MEENFAINKEILEDVIGHFTAEKSKYYVMAVLCSVLGYYLDKKIKIFGSKDIKIPENIAEKLDSVSSSVSKGINISLSADRINLFKEFTKNIIKENFGSNDDNGIISQAVEIAMNMINAKEIETLDLNDDGSVENKVETSAKHTVGIDFDFSKFGDLAEATFMSQKENSEVLRSAYKIIDPIFSISELSAEATEKCINEIKKNLINKYKSLHSDEFLLVAILGMERHFKENIDWNECFDIALTPDYLLLQYLARTGMNNTYKLRPIAEKFRKKLPDIKNACSAENIKDYIQVLDCIAPAVIGYNLYKLSLEFLDSEIAELEEINRAVTLYCAELEKLDTEKTEETVRFYSDFTKKLSNARNENELNDYLLEFCRENNLPLPYTGDFDEFMSEKINADGLKNILKFGL